MINSDRVLSLRGIIDEDNTGKLIDRILQINFEDENNNLVESKIKDRQPIHLHLQSSGGSVSDAFALVDTILNSETPVYTFCDGYAYSAAVFIYLAGERRFSFKHSWFIIHNIKTKLGSLTTQNIQDNLDYLNVLENQILEFLTSRTKLGKVELLEKLNHNMEYMLTSEQALSKGIVTDILL